MYLTFDTMLWLSYVNNNQIVLYNLLLNLPQLELWERLSIEDAILSEKIFDV